MAFDRKSRKCLNEGQACKWVYDEAVLSHCRLKALYPNQYLSIKVILKNEKHKGANPFKNQKALCLDKIEIADAKAKSRNQRSTMDMAIGVVERVKRTNKRIRLVECKFDVNNTHQKLIEDLKDKYQKTKEYFDFDCMVQKGFVVLLNDNFYQQGLRFIKNGFSNSMDCEVMTVNCFHDRYF